MKVFPVFLIAALAATPGIARSFACSFDQICVGELFCEKVALQLIATDQPRDAMAAYAADGKALLIGDADLISGVAIPSQFLSQLAPWDDHLPMQPTYRNDGQYVLGKTRSDGVRFDFGQEKLMITMDGTSVLTTPGLGDQFKTFSGSCRDMT